MKRWLIIGAIGLLFLAYGTPIRAAETKLALSAPPENGFQVGDTVSLTAPPGIVVLTHSSGKQLFIPIDASGTGSYQLEATDPAGSYRAAVYTNKDQQAASEEQQAFLEILPHEQPAEATISPELTVIESKAVFTDPQRDQLTADDKWFIELASSEKSLQTAVLIATQGDKIVRQPLTQTLWDQHYSITFAFSAFKPEEPIKLVVEAQSYEGEKVTLDLGEKHLAAPLPLEAALRVQAAGKPLTATKTILYTGEAITLEVQAPYAARAAELKENSTANVIPVTWNKTTTGSEAQLVVPGAWAGKELTFGEQTFLIRKERTPFKKWELTKNDRSQTAAQIAYQDGDKFQLRAQLYPDYQQIEWQHDVLSAPSDKLLVAWQPGWKTVRWKDWDGKFYQTQIPWQFTKSTPNSTKTAVLPDAPAEIVPTAEPVKALQPIVKVPLKKTAAERPVQRSAAKAADRNANKRIAQKAARKTTKKTASRLPYWLGGAILIGMVIISGNRSMKL